MRPWNERLGCRWSGRFLVTEGPGRSEELADRNCARPRAFRSRMEEVRHGIRKSRDRAIVIARDALQGGYDSFLLHAVAKPCHIPADQEETFDEPCPLSFPLTDDGSRRRFLRIHGVGFGRAC